MHFVETCKHCKQLELLQAHRDPWIHCDEHNIFNHIKQFQHVQWYQKIKESENAISTTHTAIKNHQVVKTNWSNWFAANVTGRSGTANAPWSSWCSMSPASPAVDALACQWNNMILLILTFNLCQICLSFLIIFEWVEIGCAITPIMITMTCLCL